MLLYGCRVAAGAIGRQFVQHFQSLTGSRVFSSTDWVGTGAFGTRWRLRSLIGQGAGRSLAFSDHTLATYPVALGFATPITLAVGVNPRTSPVVADFNGDSNLDIAVANFNVTGSGSISILLGDGNGGFGPQSTFASGNLPRGLAAGLFNGDSHLDLAVTNRVDDTVSILLGNGSGGFGAPTPFSVGSAPFSVAVGDFDGDARQDLVVSNRNDDDVSVLLGDGTGNFGTATDFTVGNEPRFVVTHDFDGDGNLDLVTADATDDTVSILLGNGSGGFSSPTAFTIDPSSNPVVPIATDPNSIAVGDFNGDGNLDLVTANSSISFNVSVLLGDGSGSFGAPTTFSVPGPYFIRTYAKQNFRVGDLSCCRRNCDQG